MKTLNEVLAELGYTTTNAGLSGTYAKLIWRDGKVAARGTADDIWTWLRDTGQLAEVSDCE